MLNSVLFYRKMKEVPSTFQNLTSFTYQEIERAEEIGVEPCLYFT